MPLITKNMSAVAKIPLNLIGRERNALDSRVIDVLTYLERVNASPRDTRITFKEEGHEYRIDGIKTKASCTGIVKRLFSEFDANKVIENILKSTKYRFGHSPYSGKSAEEIKGEWSRSGKKAADLGTEMHAIIEFWMNCWKHERYNIDMFDLEETNVPKELSYFRNFCNDYLIGRDALEPFRTEWVIFDEHIHLAGSIDMIFKSHGPLPVDRNRSCPDWAKDSISHHEFAKGEERYWIFDWKRSKEMKFNYCYNQPNEKYIKLTSSSLENCDYSKYSLQLNFYRRMIEKNYGIKIAGMVLVSIHPNHDNYLTYQVPFLEDEIDQIYEKYEG